MAKYRTKKLKTFEEVDAHVKTCDPARLAAPVSADAAKANLCDLWAKAGPIVQFLINFPFLPARWRQVIQALIGTVDMMCTT